MNVCIHHSRFLVPWSDSWSDGRIRASMAEMVVAVSFPVPRGRKPGFQFRGMKMYQFLGTGVVSQFLD